MEVERNASLPFISVELLNLAPRIKTKVYVKPTNIGLLLHYQSHVDNRYKRSLITTMLDRAYHISSDWSYFSQECDGLETVFLKLLKVLEALIQFGCQAIRRFHSVRPAAHSINQNDCTRHPSYHTI